MLERSARRLIANALQRTPIVSLLGPRQSGKTTLAREFAGQRKTTIFDLENPTDTARLSLPMNALEPLRGLVVIDEIQRMPELFDDPPRSRGSSSHSGALSHSRQCGSPARPWRVRKLGGPSEPHRHRGIRPLGSRSRKSREALVARRSTAFVSCPIERISLAWRKDYVRDFLQRDLIELGVTIPSATLGRFWNMIAHYHGGVWNAAEFARSLGASENTARRYLDLLSGAWAVRQLQPWFENIGKRQIRSPKVYVRDVGLLHALLDLETHDQLMGHQKVGASFEGFVIEQVVSLLRARDAYFWATHQGAELDLLIMHRGKRFGFEIKLSESPTVTKSMRIATENLSLAHLFVVFPGASSFSFDKQIEAVAVKDLPARLSRLR